MPTPSQTLATRPQPKARFALVEVARFAWTRRRSILEALRAGCAQANTPRPAHPAPRELRFAV